MGLTRAALSTAATSSPFSLSPLTSVGAATLATVGALNYLKDSDMNALRDRALSSAPATYSRYCLSGGGLSPNTYCGEQCEVAPDSSLGYPYLWHVAYKGGSRYASVAADTPPFSCDGQGSPNLPSLADSVKGLASDSILATAASAAARSADSSNASKDYDAALAAALAAMDAVSLVSSTASQVDKDAAAAANSAALAAAAIARAGIAAAAAAKDAQDRDKAEADRLAPPSKLPKKDFSNSTNFVSFFLDKMSNKFPLDIIYGATDNVNAPLCPTFELFHYQWTLCFLLPLFTSIRWIVFLSLSTKFIMEF